MQPAQEQHKQQGRQDIVATKGKFNSVFSVLEIPVEESELPVRKLAKFNPSEVEVPDNDQMYSVDQRNPTLKLRFEIDKTDGVDGNHNKEKICISFRKLEVVELFEKMQEIQDKLDLYT